MIVSLSVKNFALIQDITTELYPGMTVLTGETGAGKSILLGAMGLLLGRRADLKSAGDPSHKVIVEATFAVAQFELQPLFESLELDYEPLTIIRREILPSGKSRAFVNDSPVSVAQLQGLGPFLVDIHSQHQNMAITTEDYQLGVLDALSGTSDLIPEYRSTLATWKELGKELELRVQERAEAIRERDYRQFQFEELESAELDSLQLEELESEQQLLAHAETLRDSMGTMQQLIQDEQYGLGERLRALLREAQTVGEKAPHYSDWAARIDSARIDLDDLLGEVDSALEKTTADPTRLMEIEDRLSSVHQLLHKHQLAGVPDLIELRAKLQHQLLNADALDGRIDELKETLAGLTSELKDKAARISEGRKVAIPKLLDELAKVLSEIGLPDATFTYLMGEAKEFREHGTDTLQLLFSANKGGRQDELRKVASGGEMSRIMLAVKAVLNRHRTLPTIVLDEIDTGVSGEMARRIAMIMREMSRNSQLLVVTHLPQIAAKGNHHLQVFKQTSADRTTTSLQALNAEQRVVEIAQMIGGRELSDSALAHARELLN